MKIRTSILCLCFLALLPCIAQGAIKNVTINWMVPSEITNIQGYRLYYSYSSDMSGKILLCGPIYDPVANSLTCDNVDIASSPVYFTVAVITPDSEIESSPKSVSLPEDTTIAVVQDFKMEISSSSNDPQWLNADGNANWTIAYVDSEETLQQDGKAINAIDGDINTIWHTEWSASDTPYPHEIQIDLGRIYTVSNVHYQPRVGNPNGQVSQYALYLSTDGQNWGTPVHTGTFSTDNALKEISFTATAGRYVRFVALSEVNGNPWANAAEIDVYAK